MANASMATPLTSPVGVGPRLLNIIRALDSRQMVKMLILTGQRRNDVAAMTWDEVDLDTGTWVIPGRRHKAGRQHSVPLSAPVVDLLRGIDRDAGPYPFSARANKDRPFSGFSRAKRDLDRRSGVSDWRLHDIRRTVATGMQAIDIPPHIIEAVAGRSGFLSGVAGVYQRHSYDKEKRHALDRWADHLMEFVE